MVLPVLRDLFILCECMFLLVFTTSSRAVVLMSQEEGYLELKKPGTLSHCKEECETIAKVGIRRQADLAARLCLLYQRSTDLLEHLLLLSSTGLSRDGVVAERTLLGNRLSVCRGKTKPVAPTESTGVGCRKHVSRLC